MKSKPYFLFSAICALAILGANLVPAAARSTGETVDRPGSSSLADTTLDVCIVNEPATLFVFGEPNTNYSRAAILQAVYDGPVDNAGYANQAVVLQNLPTLSSGEVVLSETSVTIGDKVVDYWGDIHTIDAASVLDLRQIAGYFVTFDFSIQPVGTTIQSQVTYPLLPGLTWEDGNDLTADDFVFGWDVAASVDVPYDKYYIERTKLLTATAPLTLVWTGLPGYPIDPPYLDGLDIPLPVHIYGPGGSRPLTPAEMMTDNQVNRDPLSYGPFKVENWVSGDRIELTRNAQYFRAAAGLPRFENLVYHFSADPLADLLNGVCDLSLNDAIYDYSTLTFYDDQGYLKIHMAPAPQFEHIDFNLQPDPAYTGFANSLAFQDPNLRHAVAHCFDRLSVLNGPLDGAGYVAEIYIPPNHPYYPTNPAIYPFDPAAGRALLAASGWVDSNGNGIRDKSGLELTFRYSSTDRTLRKEILALVSNQLRFNCGINAVPEYYPGSSLFAACPPGPLNCRTFDVAQYTWITSVEPVCDLYETGTVQNYPGYSSIAFDQACSAARSATDPTEKKLYHQQAAEIFSQDLPALPLYYSAKIGAAAPHIQGFAIDSTAITLWNIESIAPNLTQEIPPGGGSLESPLDNTSYTFPAGTFSETVTIIHTPLTPDQVQPPNSLTLLTVSPSLSGIGHYFETQAVNNHGQATQPGQSYSMAVTYTDQEQNGTKESTLRLYSWSGSAWAPEASSGVDTAANTVTAQPTHLGVFAVFGETERKVFMPLTIR